MADTVKAVNKKKGLPPLSPHSEADGDTETKPARKKLKKKTTKTETNGDVTKQEEAPVVKKRKKRAPSQNRESETDPAPEPPGDRSAATTPRKKKKKKPKAQEDEAGVEQGTQDGGGDRGKKEGTGSKTSLLSKDTETPRKKGGKKKKKVKKSPAADDEYGENQWAEDLQTLADDILPSAPETKEKEEEKEDEEERDTVKPTKTKTTFLTGPMLKSQPLDKIFVESSRKFKGLNKSTLNKQIAEETVKADITPVLTRKTTIDFALTSHLIFRVISLFLHGMTAGLCLWQMVNIFTLTTFSTADFLTHYKKTSMPLQCILYFLLSWCLVSACDRFDIGNPMPRFVMRAFTLQNGAISIVFYLVALVLNVATLKYEDKIYLYEEPTNTTIDNEDIDIFKSLNTARCVFAVLGWFILSITPNSDRLGKNLKSGETGLENELQMDGISAA